MIGYVTLGTNDLEKACAFYDPILEMLGAGRMGPHPRGMIYGAAPDKPMLVILTPFDGKPATAGNGTMIALPAKSREKVDEVHRKALELGAQNEGDPGQRAETFYGGYFRDPDGNKLTVFYMSSQ